MSDSICRFMPVKNNNESIKTINFVYETEFKTLRQPFFRAVYAAYLVIAGNAVLKMVSGEYELKKGSLFFAFPASLFEIDGSDDFEYIYISFTGTYVDTLFEGLEITLNAPVYQDMGHLIDFWKHSIKRINQTNAIILTESVLLYTLSFINNKELDPAHNQKNDSLLGTIVDYVDLHYKDSDMSLKKIADKLSYTEKYLSQFFKKNMNVGFNTYLTNLRIQYACELIESNITSVSQIATLCGYSDSLYFSRVFKKYMGVTPTEYIKHISKNNRIPLH